jgi:hypothetical protein
VALQRDAGARQLRVLVCQLDEVLDDRPAGRAVVGAQHLGGTQMQLFDRGEPHQPKDFTTGHDGEREPRDGGQA